jgi:excisionase family DNA binding protein
MTYSIRDICDRYGVHEATVLGWIHRGELRAVNVGREPGKQKPRWRITQAALDAWEALRTTTPPQPKIRRRRKTETQQPVVNFY